MKNTPLLSIVTPAYNESENLPALYARLEQALGNQDFHWEWFIVDDHSFDDTFNVAAQIAAHDRRVRVVRFARNFGSHRAIWCGLDQAAGQCAIVIAADLQDPPEIIPALFAKWKEDAQVVWAVRSEREGEKTSTRGFARAYYILMREVIGMKDIPEKGADVFLIDRTVINALRQFGESNVSLFALITWMGFRQQAISYAKQPRLHGRSGWSFEKKINLALDSVISFTYLPIRSISYLGLVIAMLGFVYAAVVIANAVLLRPVEGWTSLMVVLLVLGGIQMIMMGVLGEYLWRALDETRRRPRYLIEAVAPNAGSGPNYPPFNGQTPELSESVAPREVGGTDR